METLNKTLTEITDELMEVYFAYNEYQSFDDMVKLFAEDDFYKLHNEANIFLKRRGE